MPVQLFLYLPLSLSRALSHSLRRLCLCLCKGTRWQPTVLVGPWGKAFSGTSLIGTPPPL